MTDRLVFAGDEGLRLDWCSHEAARHAVMAWHYSRRMPVGKLVKVGAWEGGRFVGVVMFGRGGAPDLGTPYGLDRVEVCELVRVALTSHASTTTAIVAGALRMVRLAQPGLRLVVSFADEAQGHRGTIYQAGNWVYAGTTEQCWFRVASTLVHPKTLHSRYGQGGQSVPWLRAHVDPRAERVRRPPKHRYLFPLDRGMRRRIEPLRQPYP